MLAFAHSPVASTLFQISEPAAAVSGWVRWRADMARRPADFVGVVPADFVRVVPADFVRVVTS